MEELVELEIEVRTFPDATIYPEHAVGHILESLGDILCATRQVSVQKDSDIREEIV